MLIFALLSACSRTQETEVSAVPAGATNVQTESKKSDDAKVASAEPIGQATMQENGTLVLNLQAIGPNGEIGHGVLTYPPTDPQYEAVLEHIGALKPGQTVEVYPWPDPPAPQ